MSDFINTIDQLGDNVVFNSIIEKTIAEFKDDIVTSIGNFAFYSCTNLTTVILPNVISVGTSALRDCANLATVDLHLATSIGEHTFRDSQLTTLILRSSTMCVLSGAYSCNGTNISKKTGYIYVPNALIEDYKVATNWSKYANQFRALEDYTVDGTTTGELDPTKI